MLSNFKFSKGLIFNSELQIFIIPVTSFLISHNLLVNSFTKEELVDFYDTQSLDDTYFLYQYFSRFTKNKKVLIENVLNYLSSMGSGNIKLIKLTNNKIIFTESNLKLSKLYFDMFGENPKIPIGYFVAALLKNYLSFVYGREIKIKLLKLSKFYQLECAVLGEEFNFNSDKIYDLESSNSKPTPWIKELIIKKKIISEENILGINGIHSIGTPLFSYFKILEKVFEKNFDSLVSLTSIFGDKFINILDIKGVKTPKEKFNYICLSWGLVGYGKLEIIDLEKGCFKVHSNIYSKYYKYFTKDFIKKYNIFSFSSLKGSYDFSFNINTVSNLDLNESIICFDKLSDDRVVSEKVKEIQKLVLIKDLIK